MVPASEETRKCYFQPLEILNGKQVISKCNMTNMFMTTIFPRENVQAKTYLTKFYKVNPQKENMKITWKSTAEQINK